MAPKTRASAENRPIRVRQSAQAIQLTIAQSQQRSEKPPLSSSCSALRVRTPLDQQLDDMHRLADRASAGLARG
jgi:hypothetical protein